MSTPSRYQRTPVRAVVAEKTPGQLAAEQSTAQAEAAAAADRAGRDPEAVDNLVVVEHKITTLEPSANAWQLLSESRLRACDPATLRAIAGMRGYGERRGHASYARLTREGLVALILHSQLLDSRLHDPDAQEALSGSVPPQPETLEPTAL